ncbi:MAG TPA: glycosyltransferase [Candidatus Saccharimonadales bacterium]|nr:glycosyltransferase [Candidatus Saccharimonadales bacterium]
MKIGIVVPHIFMQRDILPSVIFAPAELALGLAAGVQAQGADVTLFTPGPVDTAVTNVTGDLSGFKAELAGRGYGYIELLKKHPLVFVSLARQVQAELIAKAFAMANSGQLDVVHIYTNEEDIALPFVQLCTKPVVLTHHDPFTLLIRYKHVFPKYKQLNWISMSHAQRGSMPSDTNWVGNIYHGLPKDRFALVTKPGTYIAYLGRIIEAKGVHLAIAAVKQYNQNATKPITLRIAGKHYAGHKDDYWREQIEPHIDGKTIIYDGFLDTDAKKQSFLGNAAALLVPSVFEEPFGMVAIEALACGTPVIGLDSGALPELITDGQTGFIAKKGTNDTATATGLAALLGKVHTINRQACRNDFEARFTLERMCAEHLEIYKKLTT